MKQFYKVLLLAAFGMNTLFGGTTGKIAGKITDTKSGDPLPGVTIVLTGTSYGAATDFNGDYFINNLPPGTYTLRTSAVGYNTVTYDKIKVNIDLTTRMDLKLSEAVIDIGKEVVITAERALVQKDLTSTTAVVNGDDIKQLPVTELQQVINLQAGNVGGNIRGGRKGEVAYWIDGVPVTDAFDGSSVIDVNPNMVQELQVLSGAFNAEYGQAMSGIVNIATREGAEKYSGSISSYLGDFLSTHNDIYKGINGFKTFDPTNIRNLEASLSGPVVGKDISFFFNARDIYYGGYLNGIRKYNPNAVTAGIFENGTPTAYVLGSNPSYDSAIVFSTLTPANNNFDSAYAVYHKLYYNGTGDGKTVAMNWNRKLYLQGKLSIRLTPTMKLNVTGIKENFDQQPYDRAYQYEPDGKGTDYTRSYTGIFQFTHTLSNSTFYTLGGSLFEKSFKHYLYADPYDPHYVHPNINDRTLTSYSFKTGGTDLNRFYRTTTTALGKFDLSSQVNNEHFVKAGIETRLHRVFLEDINLIPVATQTAFTPILSSPYIATQILPDSSNQHDRYVHKPVELSGYLQDKMEFKDLIINIGVRVDYFDPDGVILADDEDPYIYQPAKAINTYFDDNGNGVQDANEPLKTVDDRRAYWYKKAPAKVQISPRFGASFPITDRGVIHFSYGHFFQAPSFERLYANPLFKVGQGTGNVDHNGVPTGNADLKPQQTINGEIGLQQQLTEDLGVDVTAYLRDVRNLIGTRADQIPIGGGFASRTYTKYVNSDFGFIRGFIVSLSKRFTQGLSLNIDYTFQIARGSASDPNQARNDVTTGKLPEVQLSPLGWDQRHTLNAVLNYAAESYGGSIISQYGSGQPYTPDVSQDVTVFLTNSESKPQFFNTDVRLYKSFRFDPIRLLFFLRVTNIFDTQNELNVYGDTGRAGKTYNEARALQTGAPEYVNTIHDYFVDPTQYSEPRRIEFGATVEF
jgi:outer membrane receptor protein involved in Fe transport